MKAMAKLLVSACISIAAFLQANAQQPYTILPQSEAQNVTRLCSRTGFAKIDSGWLPTDADIKIVESHLALLSQPTSDGQSVKTPTDYFRQYVGVVVLGRKLIYLNALGFSDAEAGRDSWKTRFVNICDGGDYFWGAIYDPATGTFSELHKNGYA